MKFINGVVVPNDKVRLDGTDWANINSTHLQTYRDIATRIKDDNRSLVLFMRDCLVNAVYRFKLRFGRGIEVLPKYTFITDYIEIVHTEGEEWGFIEDSEDAWHFVGVALMLYTLYDINVIETVTKIQEIFIDKLAYHENSWGVSGQPTDDLSKINEKDIGILADFLSKERINLIYLMSTLVYEIFYRDERKWDNTLKVLSYLFEFKENMTTVSRDDRVGFYSKVCKNIDENFNLGVFDFLSVAIARY